MVRGHLIRRLEAWLQAVSAGCVVGSCIAAAPALGAATDCARWQQTAASQTLMNACAAKDAQRSSRDVAKRYLDYRETLAGGRRSALDASQRAWAKYRETYCAEKAAAVSGGSIQPLVTNLCVDTLNKRRAVDLSNDRKGA